MGDNFSKGIACEVGTDSLHTPREQHTPKNGALGCSPWSDESADDSTPMWGPASAVDTIIIFDWDDTLLCSSAINTHSWSHAQLEQLEKSVESLLQMAMTLGETMIVTNGNGTWVKDSSRRFLPNLERTLDRMQVMSARACYEQSFPNNPFAWKRNAFREILAQRRQEGWHGSCVNLVVLGDSPAEIEAAQQASKVISGRSKVKTLKFKDAPSANELLGQLRRATQELASIVMEDKSVSRSLVQRSFPGTIDTLASWASGWRIVDTESLDYSYSRVAATLLVGA